MDTGQVRKLSVIMPCLQNTLLFFLSRLELHAVMCNQSLLKIKRGTLYTYFTLCKFTLYDMRNVGSTYMREK